MLRTLLANADIRRLTGLMLASFITLAAVIVATVRNEPWLIWLPACAWYWWVASVFYPEAQNIRQKLRK